MSIHPFGDGNGRSSASVMNYVVKLFSLPMAVVFIENRAGYIKVLEAARNSHTPEPFSEFMFEQYYKLLIDSESNPKVNMGTGRDVLYIPDAVFDDDLNN